MLSRLAITASSRAYSALYAARNQALFPRLASGAAVKGRTADPKIHSGELEAGPDVHTGEAQGIENHPGNDHKFNDFGEKKPKPGSETDLLGQPKLPHESSPRLKSSPVNHPLEPNLQQRRTKVGGAAAIEDVSCVGVDGTPFPESKERDQGEQREQTKDDKEYFKDHKASPLSEIEVADTRKPITRATDGTKQSGGDVIGWKPEQLLTAEETLLRASEIWKENATRGIPELPHSRRLRELRGEWF